MIGKLIASVVKGAANTVELGAAVVTDVVKAPLRICGGDGCICEEGESLMQDTLEKACEILEDDE